MGRVRRQMVRTLKNKNKMKLGEIKKKIDKAKKLMSEYVMLETLANIMIKAKKEHPDDLVFSEEYYQNVVNMMSKTKESLEKLFK